MARLLIPSEQVELDGLIAELALAKIAASNAPPMQFFFERQCARPFHGCGRETNLRH
jgi:hypothetical protein